MKSRFKTISLSAILLVFSTAAVARPIHIIHTNDLHSHMEFAGSRPERGGFAAVKRVIDRLRADSQARGIPTLVLDGGDFSEGSPLFLADEGLRSWQALNEMGYDAVALGNHDYQIGTTGMDDLLSRFDPRFALLAANYSVSKDFPHAQRAIQPSASFTRGGLRIAVMGLTTDELFYRWTASPGGKVRNPVKTAEKVARELNRSHDIVIALTHTGVEVDHQLLERVPELTLVVGGHSHTFLHEPVKVVRKDAPTGFYVQTGEHGRFVGDLLVDLEPGREPVVLRYQLVDVERETVGEDPQMQEFVAETRQALEDRYGRGWMDEVIAWSDIPMDRPIRGTTEWSRIFVKTFRERTGADVGLDVGEFYGESQPGGPITRDKLIRYYPRIFNPKEKRGWTIWTVGLHGKALTEIIEGVAASGIFFNLDGLTYTKTYDKTGKLKLKDFRIHGKWVNPVKRYKVAVSEGLGLGSKRANWFARAYFRPRNTGIFVWEAVEAQLRALRVAESPSSVRQ